MNEHEAYQRLGALGVTVTTAAGLHKLGVFRAILRWLRGPSKASVALAAVTEAVEHSAKATQEQTLAIRSIQLSLEHMSATLRATMEQGLINAAAHRIIMHESATPRWEMDGERVMVDANPAMCALFGRPRSEMLGAKWLNSVVPGHAPEIKAALQRAFVSSDDDDFVHPFCIENGGHLTNLVARSVEVVRNQDGKIIRMMGTCKRVADVAA